MINLVARPIDPKIIKTYTFKILAIAEGGYKHLTTLKTLIMKCYADRITISPAADFLFEVVIYKTPPGVKTNYIFPEFTSSHPYCGIKKYDLDNNNDGSVVVKPTGLDWDTECNPANNLCRNILVTSDVSKNFTFWLKVESEGSKTEMFKVAFIVKCGIEEITTKKDKIGFDYGWPRLDAGSANYTVTFADVGGVSSAFDITLSQCGIVEYNLFYNADMTSPIYNEPLFFLKDYQDPSRAHL